MSIPPLVCSTPPPPDQCEDDRDTEDFDMQYNLSQEDEDEGNNYNYGSYSDYIYPTSTSTNIQQCQWSPDISKKSENKLHNNVLEEKTDSISILPESDSSSVNRGEFEDIEEDLNLKVDNQNDVASEQSINKYEIEPSCIEGPSTVVNSLDVTSVIENEDVGPSFLNTQEFPAISPENDNKTALEEKIKPEEAAFVQETEKPFEVEIEEINLNVQVLNIESKEIGPHDIDDSESVTNMIDQKHTNDLETKIDDLADDDFGDFDDFQFVPSEKSTAPTIQFCDNPWDSEVSKNCEFGDFTANFDVDENNINIKSDNSVETNIEQHLTPPEDSDDFGDFDDFKSSFNDHEENIMVNTEPSQNVPVLSLYSPDNEVQIIESINSVLSSIFTSEISEFESDFESKLDSLLNETWGHLVDTDVRQPYIVNWNNSLGQKSLLKALCIDSRNILFGPKWNNGMPKYAANLTVAPLQPKKPFTPTTTTSSEEQYTDKNTKKQIGTWTDPFTSDGQESCNTESGTSASITRPTNLDVFTNVAPPEIDKIYSTTLSVQPIRQINLPDTHIFTPTDSETPRSKTIHYSQVPNVLVPSEENHQTDNSKSQSRSEVAVNNAENDEDYWEFQDFKGSVGNKNSTSVESQVKTEVSVTNTTNLSSNSGTQTQILQPIKVEPTTPALNWPAPGEVIETFDDFSEFISNTSWNNDNVNTVNQDSQVNNKEVESVSKIEALDDEFETFQSAPNLKSSIAPTENIYQSATNINHRNFSDISQNFNEINDISYPMHSKADGFDTVKSKETFVQSHVPLTTPNSFATVKDVSIKTSQVLAPASQTISTTILQPSIASTSGSQRTQQKTGQILQPLTLESYSQINWPNPGIDLQDLSRFNPVESLQSLKTDASTGGSSKLNSPAHKDVNAGRNEISDDDIWGDFVSSKPKQNQAKKLPVFADDDEWTDFVSSPSVKPQNGLNTISLNVHTNLNMQKNSGPSKFPMKSNQIQMDIPTLNYVTPKSSNRGLYNDKHFQNL